MVCQERNGQKNLIKVRSSWKEGKMIEIPRERWERFTLIRMRLGKDASGER